MYLYEKSVHHDAVTVLILGSFKLGNVGSVSKFIQQIQSF